MSDKEFYSFYEALDALKLKEEELKRLVSEGEIRAFRDGDTMRLRRADVENLKTQLTGGEVVDVANGGEELVFEDDADLQEAGMATEEISEMDTLLEEDVEDLGGAVPPTGTTAAAARRRPALARAPAEEKTEGMGMRALLMVTSLVMLLTIPVAVSASTGEVGSLAKSIAGIFTKF